MLAGYLEEVYRRYHRVEYLAPDPLLFLHRYRARDDVEVVGLIASLLAYGRVARILVSVETVLDALGPRPGRAVVELGSRRARSRLAGFVHRWSRGDDVAALLVAAGRTIERHGSLEAAFTLGYARGAPSAIHDALHRFTAELRSRAPRSTRASRGFRFLLPDPQAGSACKRLNLFLRWMVRRDDPLDRGIWRSVSGADLIMPLDTHVARISRNLGLSSRRTTDWRMAEEVTAALGRVDPADPTRFDFSLCRLGILGECPTREDLRKCASCELKPACRLYRSLADGGRSPRPSAPAPKR